MVYQHTTCDLRYDLGAIGADPDRAGQGVRLRFGTAIDVTCTVGQARQLATEILIALDGPTGAPCNLCGGAAHFDDVECPRCGGTGVVL